MHNTLFKTQVTIKTAEAEIKDNNKYKKMKMLIIN